MLLALHEDCSLKVLIGREQLGKSRNFAILLSCNVILNNTRYSTMRDAGSQRSEARCSLQRGLLQASLISRWSAGDYLTYFSSNTKSNSKGGVSQS